MIDNNFKGLRFSQIKDRIRRCSSAGLHYAISENIILENLLGNTSSCTLLIAEGFSHRFIQISDFRAHITLFVRKTVGMRRHFIVRVSISHCPSALNMAFCLTS
jgi:hypothetical protein